MNSIAIYWLPRPHAMVRGSFLKFRVSPGILYVDIQEIITVSIKHCVTVQQTRYHVAQD